MPSPPPRYVTDATVAIFVAILLFIVPSQKPKFNFCSQTEEGNAPVLALHSSGLGALQQRLSEGVLGLGGREAHSIKEDGQDCTVWAEGGIFQASLSIVQCKISFAFETFEIVLILHQERKLF